MTDDNTADSTIEHTFINPNPEVYKVLLSPYKLPFWTRVKQKLMFWKKRHVILRDKLTTYDYVETTV